MSDKPFEALGEKLRSQRETKGLSLKAIADKTRIPPSVLQALESGDNSQLPAHVFVKGFLRSYSIEIGLNPEEIVGEYNYINPNQEKPVAVPVTARKGLEERSWVWLIIPVFILLLVAGTLVYFYLPSWQALVSTPRTATSLPADQEGKPGKPQAMPPDVSPSLQKPADKVEAGTAGQTPTETVSPAPTESATRSGEPTTEMASTQQPDRPDEGGRPDSPGQPGEPEPAGALTSAATASTSTAGDVASPAQGHDLTLNFRDDVWIQIVVDDNAVQHGLFKSGMSKTWHADKGFFLRIGNAGGVSVFFDGKDMGFLGGEGKVVALDLPEKSSP